MVLNTGVWSIPLSAFTLVGCCWAQDHSDWFSSNAIKVHMSFRLGFSFQMANCIQVCSAWQLLLFFFFSPKYSGPVCVTPSLCKSSLHCGLLSLLELSFSSLTMPNSDLINFHVLFLNEFCHLNVKLNRGRGLVLRDLMLVMVKCRNLATSTCAY